MIGPKIYAIRRGHVMLDEWMPMPAIFIKIDKDSEEFPLTCYDECVLEKGLQDILNANDVECFDSNYRYNAHIVTKEEIDELLKKKYKRS